MLIMIDVIIPTKLYPHYKKCIQALKENTPVPYRLFLVTEGDSWPQAVNKGIEKSMDSDNDIVIMDDDIEVLPQWLDKIDEYKKKADMIGFKLLYPNGRIYSAGGKIVYTIKNRLLGLRPYGVLQRGWLERDGANKYGKAEYVPHVTASLVYIRKYVLKEIQFDESFPGMQYEDTDFCYKALIKGYKIMYIPNKAIHHSSLTKRRDPLFSDKLTLNSDILYERWFTNPDFISFFKSRHFIFTQFFNSQAGESIFIFSKKYLLYKSLMHKYPY
jgi:GT2 family glycosyltransferase